MNSPIVYVRCNWAGHVVFLLLRQNIIDVFVKIRTIIPLMSVKRQLCWTPPAAESIDRHKQKNTTSLLQWSNSTKFDYGTPSSTTPLNTSALAEACTSG
jgi:hypothetical protein